MGAPPWGKWYWKQAKAFEALESMPEHVVVAWAPADGKRGFVYGVFESMARFYEYLQETPPLKRVGFEIIRENRPCRLYLDVEWVGDADPEHVRIRRLCSLLREDCREQHGWDALRLYVTCGSRVSKERHKNSYHVHANVHFENNHNGDMKTFVKDFVDRKLGGDEWTWRRDSGDAVHFVDSVVYTKNRPFRPPENCKPGGTPQVRISGDPADADDPLRSRYEFTDEQSWRPCIVSCAATSEDEYTGPKRTAPVHSVGTVQGNKRKRKADEGNGPPDDAAAPGANLVVQLPESVRNALLGADSRCYHPPGGVKNFPSCIELQLNNNFVCKNDITQLQVTRPDICVPRFFRCESERHAHSSNGCLVLVVRQRQAALVELLGEVQVYVKCFCEKEPDAAFGRLGVEDKRLKELPRYEARGARAKLVRYVVETQYGIGGVMDAGARREVCRVYQLSKRERDANMRDPKLKVAWAHVFACDGGWRPWPLRAPSFVGPFPQCPTPAGLACTPVGAPGLLDV